MGFASYFLVLFLSMTSILVAHGDTPWDPRSVEEIWEDLFGPSKDEKEK